MAATASLGFDIFARDRGANKTFGRLRASIGATAKGIGILGAAAAGGIAIFAKGALAEARDAQKVAATTTQIIKSTGGAAKVTAGQVGDLAERLSVKAGVDDEVIQTGANLLLTFKNVRNEAGKGAKIFDRATAAAVDLSAAGFGSVDSSAKMLGKALNDPLKGITALSRAGVTFTESQKKKIESLVKEGDVLKAQKIILREVESQVGGVAAANATLGDKAKVAWGNFQEAVGTRFLPVWDKLVGGFIKALPKVLAFGDTVADKLGPAFQTAADGVQAFIRGLQGNKAFGAGIFVDITNAGNKLRDMFLDTLPHIKNFAGQVRDFAVTNGPKLLDVLKRVATVGANVVKWAVENRDVLVPLATVILSGVAAWKAYIAITKGLAAAKAAVIALRAQVVLLNATMRANPIGVVITALVLLGTALVIAYKKSETFRRIVDKAFTMTQVAVLQVTSIVLKFVKIAIQGFKMVTDVVLSWASTTLAAAEKALGWMPDIGPKVKKARAAFEDFRKGATKALDGAVKKVDGWDRAVNKMQDVVRVKGDIKNLESRLRSAKKQLADKNLTKERKAKINADISGLQHRLGIARDNLARLRDKTVRVSVQVSASVSRAAAAAMNIRGHNAFASGTPSAPRGPALVGENGPELVSFRGGERVRTAAQTRRMVRSGGGVGGTTMVFNFPNYVGSRDELIREIRREVKSRGGNVQTALGKG